MTTQFYTFLSLILSLICIGFFSGIEIAFVNANRLNIELKKKQGKKSGIILSKFMEQPARFLGTCLIGINLFFVVYGLLFSELLREAIWYPFAIQNAYVKLAFNTLASALLVLIFGEFIPNAIFRAKKDSFLNFFASVTDFFYDLFYPVAAVFVSLAQNILIYLFDVKIKNKDEAFSKVDLEHFFQQTRQLDEDNQQLNTELFENALSLPSIKIRQCLVPRTEIEAVDIHTSVAEVKRIFLKTHLSKIIVYEQNIDNILGYIHQLDLFKKPADIKSIILPISAVPESMGATDLITKFSKERKSIAWVVDEFGGTSGIITLEDVLEEIFGEIKDEYDMEEFVEKQLLENEFIFSGRLELHYLNEKYDFDFPKTNTETLSGYIINEYESIPKLNDQIIIGRFEFDILNVSDTRIELVKMKILR